MPAQQNPDDAHATDTPNPPSSDPNDTVISAASDTAKINLGSAPQTENGVVIRLRGRNLCDLSETGKVGSAIYEMMRARHAQYEPHIARNEQQQEFHKQLSAALPERISGFLNQIEDLLALKKEIPEIRQTAQWDDQAEDKATNLEKKFATDSKAFLQAVGPVLENGKRLARHADEAVALAKQLNKNSTAIEGVDAVATQLERYRSTNNKEQLLALQNLLIPYGALLDSIHTVLEYRSTHKTIKAPAEIQIVSRGSTDKVVTNAAVINLKYEPMLDEELDDLFSDSVVVESLRSADDEDIPIRK
jgi:hypothetical protein